MTIQVSREEGLLARERNIRQAKRVVVKVGSAVLTGKTGLNRPVVEQLAKDICLLRRSGREVILVSSGAVAAGRKKLGMVDRQFNMKEKQAVAAIGQSSLMRTYDDIFSSLGQKVAQILLTHDDFANRDRYLNVRNTLFTLLEWDILPIINENDTVSVKELRFGDNDTLGAMTTNLIEADLFACLTDVDGLYTGHPGVDQDAVLVNTISRVDAKVEKMAGNVTGALGTGGMRSKIMAAKMVSARGGCSFIGSGTQPGVLQKLFSGEAVGTFFLPNIEKIKTRKHWIAYTLRPKGYMVLDEGACNALIARGKSLLPSGILEVRGSFNIGDPVHCLDKNDKPVVAGLVNYCSSDVVKIMGAQSRQIQEILGFSDSDEVIHRDNLVVL
jgi:glutamate 5-kinase